MHKLQMISLWCCYFLNQVFARCHHSFGFTEDLRLEHERVQKKYIAMTKALIESVDVDGFRHSIGGARGRGIEGCVVGICARLQHP